MNMVDSKVFRSGNGEAVRLLREVAFGADIDVVIERTGDTLTIRPVLDSAAGKARVERFVSRLREIGPAETIGTRDEMEIPEQPGLL